jgi:hypothetical protein
MPDGILDEPRLMAQFAVNMVDQMDSDDVMTVFEYDQDLTNGWNLDDNAFDATDATGNDRQVVYGIEQQQLCLSEAQLLVAKRILDSSSTAVNHEATEFDDRFNRDWSFVELENVTPHRVDRFGNGNWQVVIEQGPTMAPTTVSVRKRWLTLLGNWAIDPTAPRFVIGTTGDEDNRGADSGMQRVAPDPLVPSHFRVDPDHNPTGPPPPTHLDPFNMGGFQAARYQLAPRANLNLDLILAPTSTYSVWPKQFNPPPGASDDGDLPQAVGDGKDFFGHTGDNDDAISPADVLDNLAQAEYPPVKLTLRRRVNPLRNGPTTGAAASEATDNPWVEVDSITVDIDVFDIDDGDEFTQIRPKLTLPSSERDEPLDGTIQNGFPGVPVDYKFNTLGLQNANSTASFQTYQPHFNRAFGSPVELLSVPLYSPFDQTPKNLKLEQSTNAAAVKIAAHKFLRPDFPDAVSIPPGNLDYDNRWYRLFEFIEVPTQQEPEELSTDNLVRSPSVLDVGNGSGYLVDRDAAGNLRTYYRRPGRVQLNTLRDPEVLAGLLDDPEVVQLSTGGTSYLVDQGADPTPRDWWKKFIEARDGKDPLTSAYLPGLPYGGIDTATNTHYGSQPFRDFSFSANDKASIEDTLFRKLPGSGAVSPNTDRLLFELGTQSQHQNGGVDHSMRHRMLSKVLNNSTNRSNVFLIFAQVDFFEAAEVQTGGRTVVRVGAKLTDSPAYRGFFVVDRSKIAQSLADVKLQNAGFDPDVNFLPQAFTDSVDGMNKFNFSFNQDFDFRQLILHRQTIN